MKLRKLAMIMLNSNKSISHLNELLNYSIKSKSNAMLCI